MNIDNITINGKNYKNVPFKPIELKKLGLTDAEIAAEKTKLDLRLHAKIVGLKVGGILIAITKDLQTQANIQAKFCLVDTKAVAARSVEEKAIHAAIIALAEWTGDTLAIGNGLKVDINADIDGADWPVFDAGHAAVIAALVEEL